MTVNSLLTDLPAFSDLKAHAIRLANTDIESLFAQDTERADSLSLDAAGLHLDYSKHLLDSQALQALMTLATQAKCSEGIADLFRGTTINNTEERPALHTLLRASQSGLQVDKFAQVSDARSRMQACADALNNGTHLGYTGDPISDVVNIGIGGSDLGPRLVTEALKPFHGPVRCHYVANVDPADLHNTLQTLDPRTTLFIVCSKSFRTQETLANSLAARAWMLAGGSAEQDLNKHFIAVTTNLEAATAFGITADNCLPMWDWVGGRYSVWSAVGISCAIAVGWNNFTKFLAGAESLDHHFSTSELHQNMPLMMALLEVWYRNLFAAGNHVVLPYDHSLQKLPAYLQQLTMESNGKRVNREGEALDYSTGSVLWGSAGTMGQHSFHQLLHQGTQLCPVDFILPLRTHTAETQQHQMLVANCLAQSRALMVGRSLAASEASLKSRGVGDEKAAALAPHLVMPGNRPNSVITMDSLNPSTLGALLALYEHRTFCSAQLWGINPFDQWGVELGKEIGTEIFSRLDNKAAENTMDPATERLIRAYLDTEN